MTPEEYKSKKEERIKTFKLISLIAVILIIVMVIVVISAYLNSQNPKVSRDLAGCLRGQDCILYISKTCPHCELQKELFGESISLIEVVDCSEEGELCKERGILKVPSFTCGNKTHFGSKTIEGLELMSGCYFSVDIDRVYIYGISNSKACPTCGDQMEVLNKNNFSLVIIDCFKEAEKCTQTDGVPYFIINGQHYIGFLSEGKLPPNKLGGFPKS